MYFLQKTRTPVRAVVEWCKFGASPEEIVENLLHLTQVFDALGYYDDHREEIERYILENRITDKGKTNLTQFIEKIDV